MAERLYRTQILLEPTQHRALSEMARREGRSMSDLVREMIRQQLEQREHAAAGEVQRRLEALELVRKHRDLILQERGGKPIDIDVVDLIHRMREERDAEILDAINHRR